MTAQELDTLPLSEISFSDELPDDGFYPDSPDYDLFEALLIEAQHRRVLSYGDVCALCADAVRRRRTSTAADFFHQGKGWVSYHAQIFNVFGIEMMRPHIPVDLYKKAMKAAQEGKGDAIHWLRMATDVAYRIKVLGYDDDKNQWSARDLSDAAGIAKGATVSDVAQITAGTEGIVTEWEKGHVGLDIEGFTPSGDTPEVVMFKGNLVEVLK